MVDGYNDAHMTQERGTISFYSVKPSALQICTNKCISYQMCMTCLIQCLYGQQLVLTKLIKSDKNII